MEKNLAARLQAGIQAWTDALEGKKKDIDLSMDTDAPAQPTHKPGGEPQVCEQKGQHDICAESRLIRGVCLDLYSRPRSENHQPNHVSVSKR